MRVGYSPRPGDPDVASTEAGLLVGWLAAALGFRVEAPDWTRDKGRSDVLVRGKGGAPIRVTFEHEPREDVRAGTVTRVELSCGEARFEVARQADPLVFQWVCRVPGLVLPSQTYRAAIHDEVVLLVRALERPKRDPLLEASLRAGSRIARPVAPRFSMRPPRLR
jgi:hypothetical protein